MRVNIKGRGIVPRVGKLAPVYNQDLQKNDIEFLLNFNQFKVYETKTGLLITKGTVDEMFAKSQQPVDKVLEPKEEALTSVVKEAPVEIEQVETPVVLNEEVDAPAIEGPIEAVEEISEIAGEEPVLVGIDLAQNDDVVVEDTSADTTEDVSDEDETVESDNESSDEVSEEPAQSTYPSKKKSKKNRR